MMRTHLILGIILSLLWISRCAHGFPGSADAPKIESQSLRTSSALVVMDTAPDLIFNGEETGDCAHTTAVGDVDGDGYPDLIVGAQSYDNQTGRAYLYYGGPNMDNEPDVVFNGEANAASRFGWLCGVGDVDNDGHDDVIIGAGYYNNSRGRAYLYWGSSRDTMDSQPDLIFAGESEGSVFAGSSWNDIVVEDIDGDSCADMVIPAAAYDNGQGRAYLYWGSSKSTMDASCDLVFTPPDTGGGYGIGLACGDIDHDGYRDIVIGAMHYLDGCGRAYLYWGEKKRDMDAICDLIFEAESAGKNSFGSNVGVGDVDNDGYDDVVIGAYWCGDRQGRAYLYWGDTKANMETTCDLTLVGERPSFFGELAIIGGDVNGDGYADILAGARQYDNWRGGAYLFFGDRREKMDEQPDLVLTGENEHDWFGDPPGGSFGDFNDDGYDDFVVGARKYPRSNETGRVYLYYGGVKKQGGTEAVPKRKGKPTKTIYQAAGDGDLEKVKSLVLEGIAINTVDEQGRTPLHHAAREGRERVAEWLISREADVSLKDENEQTPVNLAMRNNQESTVELLVSKGAAISLHLAAYSGDLFRVRSLIEKGANVNTKNNDGSAPLHFAAGKGQIDVVAILMDNGADVNATDRWGGTPLDAAAWSGHTDVAGMLIREGANVDSKSENDTTTLSWAARQGHTAVTELLISKSADIDAGDKWGRTPLYHALRLGQKEVAELLIAKGADVNTRSNAGGPVLHSTISWGQKDMSKLLIMNGADLNLTNEIGQAPLHVALLNDRRDVAELLITKGADANARDGHDQTVLHIAAGGGYKKIVELLVAEGANVNAKDAQGRTPLLRSMCYGHWNIAKFLITRGANVDVKVEFNHTPLHLAAEQGQKAVVELLIAKGAVVDERDTDANTPLHHAAFGGYTDVAQLLISKGADVNAKNKWGWTPLHRLAARGHKDMAEVLIAQGADVKAKDQDGRTPLWWAKDREHKEVVELFRKHGAEE